MRPFNKFRPSPATIVAIAALAVALGAVAWRVHDKRQPTDPPTTTHGVATRVGTAGSTPTTISSYGGSTIQQVQLAMNIRSAFVTFQAQSHRTVYVPNGGGIFVSYMAAANTHAATGNCGANAPTPATGLTTGCPDEMDVVRSTNDGASFSPVLRIKVGQHAVPSLEADSLGNVYAFVGSYQSGATCARGCDGGSWVYKFPVNNWASPELMGTLRYGFDDKITSGYDPAGPSAASGGTLWELHGGDGPTPPWNNAMLVTRVAANGWGGGQTGSTRCTTVSQQNCYIPLTTNDGNTASGNNSGGGVYSHYPYIAFDRSGSCPRRQTRPCDFGAIAWTNSPQCNIGAGYYDIRYLITTNGGGTWYGSNGAISSASFPIPAGNTGPGYELLDPSEWKATCNTLLNWLAGLYVQDGHIYLFYRRGGSNGLYRRVTPTWTGSGYTMTNDEGPVTLAGIGDANWGGVFSGYGTANSRLFLAGGNITDTGINIDSSTNDGQTWTSYATGPSTSSGVYAAAGGPTLGPNGDVIGAFTRATSSTWAGTFFHNP